MPEEEGETLVVDGIEIIAITPRPDKPLSKYRLVIIKDKRGRTYFEIKENK